MKNIFRILLCICALSFGGAGAAYAGQKEARVFDINGARSAGYSDDEIINHLAGTRKFDVDGAKKAGYSSQEILNHLLTIPTEPEIGSGQGRVTTTPAYEKYKTSLEQVEKAFLKAHNAGDTAAAQVLATEVKRLRALSSADQQSTTAAQSAATPASAPELDTSGLVPLTQQASGVDFSEKFAPKSWTERITFSTVWHWIVAALLIGGIIGLKAIIQLIGRKSGTHYEISKVGESLQTTDWIENLQRLNELRRQGALTEAEFESEKARLLNAKNEASSTSSPKGGPTFQAASPPSGANAADLAFSKDRALRFEGTEAEYASLWFRVLALNIVTLGIYSSWGIVRKRQYLHQNTKIGANNFDYLANPWAIFRGRLLIVVILAVISITSKSAPSLYLIILTGGYVIGLPYVVVKGLQFKYRNTSFAGVRFKFNGEFDGAFVGYFLYSLGQLISLTLITPFATRYRAHYWINNLSWGDKKLSRDPDIGRLYHVYWAALGLFTVIVAALSFLGFLAISDLDMLPWIVALSFYSAIIIGFALYTWGVTRELLNGLEVQEVAEFGSTIELKEAMKIGLSNLALMIITLGMYIPWATVRTLRFVCDTTKVKSVESIRKISFEDSKSDGTLTEEVGNSLFDLSL